jgi:hypothetical protein
VSIEDISPLPCRLPNVEIKKRATKKQHSDILTRTPLKEQLLEKKEKHEKNKNKKLLKNDFKPKTVVEVKKR